jgi:hypothetical protein
VADIRPIVTEKHLYYVPVPQSNMLFAVISRQEQIQFRVRTLEKKIKVLVRPESLYRSLKMRIVDLAAAVLPHELGRRVLPCVTGRI